MLETGNEVHLILYIIYVSTMKENVSPVFESIPSQSPAGPELELMQASRNPEDDLSLEL